MIYSEFIQKAADLTITEADNGLFYLEPLWQSILADNQMNLNKTGPLSKNEVLEVLKLEVEKRNTIFSKKPAVIDWVYNIITTEIQPAVLEEQTDYIKAVTDFMKQNHQEV